MKAAPAARVLSGRSDDRTVFVRVGRGTDLTDSRAGRGRGGKLWQPARLQRQIVQRRDFARQADDTQAVGAVGGNLEVDHRIAIAEWFDGGELEATQAEAFADLLGRRRHVDELTQP